MPYLTSGTAEAVLRGADPRICEIYTIFSAENFARGSSSLKTLKLLHKREFSLYHLPRLHAKAVIVSGLFASIGSQNLTRQGGRNREATVVFTESKTVETIEGLADAWLHERQTISVEMIEQMEGLLPPLVNQLRSAGKRAVEIDEAIFQCEQERLVQEQEERDRREREVRQRELDKRNAQLAENRIAESLRTRREGLQKAISRLPAASEIIYGRVKDGYLGPFQKAGKDLTKWIVGGEEIPLGRLNRYLCLLPETGKTGWVRVCQGRLSYVASGVVRTDRLIACASTDYKPSFQANWDDIEVAGSNLTVTLNQSNGIEIITLKVWFGVDMLTIVEQTMSKVSALRASVISRWISQNEDEFKTNLMKSILSPFKFNKKLTGVEASRLFGEGWYKVTLHQTDLGYPLIVARTFPAKAT